MKQEEHHPVEGNSEWNLEAAEKIQNQGLAGFLEELTKTKKLNEDKDNALASSANNQNGKINWSPPSLLAQALSAANSSSSLKVKQNTLVSSGSLLRTQSGSDPVSTDTLIASYGGGLFAELYHSSRPRRLLSVVDRVGKLVPCCRIS